MAGKGNPQKEKISAKFVTRLDNLRPGQRVRAIVFLCSKRGDKKSERRHTLIERQATIQRIQESTEQALVEVNSILDRFDSIRLTERPDALGSISVEATPAGIKAIAALKCVAVVIEDQEIGPMF